MNIGIGIGIAYQTGGGVALVLTGDWLLITGLYEDLGEWDDAATWNDGA